MSERVTLSFKPPDADFIAGSIEIKVACAKDVTIAAPLTRFTLRKPTFTVRIGINLYGGSIRLQPLILDLPPVDPANWIGACSVAPSISERARPGH